MDFDPNNIFKGSAYDSTSSTPNLPTDSPFGQSNLSGNQTQIPQGPSGRGGQQPQQNDQLLKLLGPLLAAMSKAYGIHTSPAQGDLGNDPGNSITANKQTGDIGLDYLHQHRDPSFQESSVGGNPNYNPQARLQSLNESHQAGIFPHPSGQVGGPSFAPTTINPSSGPFANSQQLSQFEGQRGIPQGTLPGGLHTLLSPFGYGYRS